MITDDPGDQRLHAARPDGQRAAYLVLSDEERAQGFVRPVRQTYVHVKCGTHTSMGRAIAETYARQPDFYGATFCTRCRTHPPVGEFRWVVDGVETDLVVGS